MLSIWRTSVGKKVVMAVTGFVLYLFVLVHMIGNLKMYLGPEAYNHYARFLREVGMPAIPSSGVLWLARAILLIAVGLHLLAAFQLWIMSRAARPVGYQVKKDIAAGYATYTMRWGGVLIALFVVYHILHFTTGTVGYEGTRAFDPENVYSNVVMGFSVWYISAFYIVAMVALGLHLYHGTWSMFQTMGLNDNRNNGPLKAFAILSAVVIAGANISFPVAVLTGVVHL